MVRFNTSATSWDDPAVCKMMMSASKSAHKHLIDAFRQLNRDFNEEGILKSHLRRRPLILSLLIAYLEERGVFPPDYFGQFLKNARKRFQVLANGRALIALLSDLEERFNGHVFALDDADRTSLRTSTQLARLRSSSKLTRESTDSSHCGSFTPSGISQLS
jgi:hypothetical protein